MTYNDVVDDPYNPNVPDLEPQTLPWEEIIRLAVLDGGMKLRVSMPAMIVAVNGNQNVDVQPLLKGRYANTTVSTNIHVIQHVPVLMPQGADYSLKLPIAVGDTGNLLFSDRSLDNWLAGGGGITDPEDSRQHDLSDAVFIPGLVPFSKQTQDNTTDMVLKNGVSTVRLLKDGSVTFAGDAMSAQFNADGSFTFTGGSMTAHFNTSGTFSFSNGTNELLDILDQISQKVQSLSQTLSTDTVNTIFGPTPLNAFATYASLASQLSALVTKLETLKG